MTTTEKLTTETFMEKLRRYEAGLGPRQLKIFRDAYQQSREKLPLLHAFAKAKLAVEVMEPSVATETDMAMAWLADHPETKALADLAQRAEKAGKIAEGDDEFPGKDVADYLARRLSDLPSDIGEHADTAFAFRESLLEVALGRIDWNAVAAKVLAKHAKKS